MALPAGMPDQEWKYYDFGANWREFLAAWKSADVQDVLFGDMQEWCSTHAYFEPDGSRPTWKRGEPLWHLSRTDYWATRHMDAAAEHIERNGCFAKFERTMAQQGRRFSDPYGAFVAHCYDAITEDMAPRPDTLESLVMIAGGEFLYDALAATARKLGFEDVVAHAGPVLLPGEKLVFDFMQYYFDVVAPASSRLLQSDEYYDSVVADTSDDDSD